jgi:hypothetical protein
VGRSADLPTVTVHFCRDRGAEERPEVWIYHGTLFAEPAEDLPAHIATIAEAGGTVLLELHLDYHGHRRWWRWQPSGPRKAARTVADLIAARRLPPYDPSVAVDYEIANADWPLPMESDGLTRQMGTTGERWELGPLTGPQARYCLSGDNWGDVLAQAECAAAIPCHWIDEATGRPFQIYDRPMITRHENETSSPDHVARTGTEDGDWRIDDCSHMPNTLTLAGLITGDPYYTMLAQGQWAFDPWHVNWRRWPDESNLDFGPFIADQTRGLAWMCRDLLVAWLLTPEPAPGWLLSRADLGRFMNGYTALLRDRWIGGNPGEPQTIFHVTQIEDPNGVAFWQENMFACVLGWWAWAGAPGDVADLFAWKVDCVIAMASGRDGYPRQYTASYWTPREAFLSGAADWGALFRATGWPPPAGGQLQGEDGSATAPDWWYASYALGALEWAVIHGIEAARAPRDWMRDEVGPSLDGRYAWTEEAAAR